MCKSLADLFSCPQCSEKLSLSDWFDACYRIEQTDIFLKGKVESRCPVCDKALGYKKLKNMTMKGISCQDSLCILCAVHFY